MSTRKLHPLQGYSWTIYNYPSWFVTTQINSNCNWYENTPESGWFKSTCLGFAFLSTGKWVEFNLNCYIKTWIEVLWVNLVLRHFWIIIQTIIFMNRFIQGHIVHFLIFMPINFHFITGHVITVVEYSLNHKLLLSCPYQSFGVIQAKWQVLESPYYLF